MLHVTNGDHAADAIRAAGIAGRVLAWRDVLHEGPVPAGLSFAELSRVRADFISGQGWGTPEAVARSLRERDDALEGVANEDEVVLWFEHDLYDQLQLIQVLDWLAGHSHPRATLINPAQYLGQGTVDEMRALFALRMPIRPEQTEIAAAAWEAFRAPDPRRMEALLALGTEALPHLGSALRRHLQEFPGVADGLSRSERQAMEAVAAAPRTAMEAYTASHHVREEAVFLGDSGFFSLLQSLSPPDAPLVVLSDGSPVRSPRSPAEAEVFRDRAVRLTELGRAVLECRADRVEVAGIDRWLGGVHLHGRHAAYRWSAAEGRIVAG